MILQVIISYNNILIEIMYHQILLKKHRKSRDSLVFALNFQKNIEKVWEIEKFCNIAKFRKNQTKNESQHFSMLKFLDGQVYQKDISKFTDLEKCMNSPMHQKPR